MWILNQEYISTADDLTMYLTLILGGREEGQNWSVSADSEHYFLENNSARNKNQYVPDLESAWTWCQ